MTSESCILCWVSGKKCTVHESASKAQQVAKPFKLHIPEHQVACASRTEICHPPSAAASAFRALLQGRASQKVLSRDLYITQYEPIMENSISQHVPSAEQVEKRNTSLHYATGHATYPDYLRELLPVAPFLPTEHEHNTLRSRHHKKHLSKHTSACTFFSASVYACSMLIP